MHGEIYDWALDDRALKFDIPVDKGICPKGHICVRSAKYEMLKYFICWICSKNNNSAFYCKGIYYPENQINITHHYKVPDPGWYEIIL